MKTGFSAEETNVKKKDVQAEFTDSQNKLAESDKNRYFILGKLIFIFFSFVNSKLKIRNHLKYFQISY